MFSFCCVLAYQNREDQVVGVTILVLVGTFSIVDILNKLYGFTQTGCNLSLRVRMHMWTNTHMKPVKL